MILHCALLFVTLLPGALSWANLLLNDTALQAKVLKSISVYDTQKVLVSQRSLVIYRIGELAMGESLEVAENNVKIFSAAVRSHSESAPHKAFYIFRIAGGKRSKLAKHLPYNLSNVALSKCAAHVKTDLAAHVNTIHMLGDPIVSKFHSVLFLSREARGPFEGRENGSWWGRINKIFNDTPSVGMIGPTISCEIAPHVQSYAFAMRSEAIVKVFAELNTRATAGKKSKDDALETVVTTTALQLGYNISSLATERHWNETVFTGTCRNSSTLATTSRNPTSWCDFRPEESLFMRWGGEPLLAPKFYCPDTMKHIYKATAHMVAREPDLQLTLPEKLTSLASTPNFSPRMSLVEEYELEKARDHAVVHMAEPKKVCFLVRTASSVGRLATKRSLVENMNLDVFISTLMRQTNLHWDAYFFVTDDKPFDEELQEILHSHNDIRLKFLDIDKKFRPKYNPIDAAYPASDEAMRIVMQKPECKWLSVTNGDNAYGSEVVRYVLHAKAAADMDLILLPMDSRNFASSECFHLRNSFKGEKHEAYCRFFEARYSQQPYGFARVSQPVIGSVDIAAMFIARDKFVEENIFFNEFSSAKVRTCLGCQDGAWVEHMVKEKGWSPHIPPLNGLKHMVFHGPSPLWCIASGNVWFDHPDSVTCVSHAVVDKLDPKYFDLTYYNSAQSTHKCLRLTAEGYQIKDQRVTVLV